jgi:hypothetical protein
MLEMPNKNINFSIAVSSDIVVNCWKEIKDFRILRIIKSFENENILGKNLKFSVREWGSSIKRFKHGIYFDY